MRQLVIRPSPLLQSSMMIVSVAIFIKIIDNISATIQLFWGFISNLNLLGQSCNPIFFFFNLACTTFQSLLIYSRGLRCSYYTSTIVVKLTLVNTQEINVTLYNQPSFFYELSNGIDPWKPSLGQLCCFLDECITNANVTSFNLIKDDWKCHEKSIISFLPTNKSFTPLTADFDLRFMDPPCPLTVL